MKRNALILTVGLILGIWISLTYINPVTGNIALTQAVLQMSGARGEFAMGTSLNALLSFSLRLIPNFAFQAFVGIRFCRHYCVASVYVFSRIPNRTKWYIQQVEHITVWAAVYQLVTMLAALAIVAIRYNLILDQFGFKMFAIHFFSYSIWTIFTTLAVNLIAILKGSDGAFIRIVGGQVALISFFSVLERISDNPKLQSIIIRLNPISCLVLNWHTSKNNDLSSAIASPYWGIYPVHSILYLLTLCLITTVAGMIVVSHHDLLVSNTETGGN